ncbi:YARHG domain-containing protein [Ursidibacter arcticus]
MRKWLFIILNFPILVAAQTQSFSHCEQCSEHLITEAELKQLTSRELKLVLNSIYARKGYVFKTPEIQRYFELKQWYKPVEDNSQITFNQFEKRNIAILQKRETETLQELKQIANALQDLKDIIENKNLVEQRVSNSIDPEVFRQFQNTIKHIDPKVLALTGVYRVTIDNGDYQETYHLEIKGTELTLSYSSATTQFYDFYNNSEDIDWSIFWRFNLENNKLSLINTEIAG